MIPSLGETISRYQLVEQLGAGGAGAVFRARDTLLDRDVALKFLLDAELDSGTSRQALVREARVAAALEHPNICAVYEVGEEEGQTFIVMALVNGLTLDEILKSRTPDVREALDLALQVAEGLRAAHARSVVHGDVKAGNVMVTAEGQAKILDFGIARTMTASAPSETGAVGGTLAYMSPERFEGRATDHRSDIWALGVLLYKMLAGTTPFEGRTAAATMYQVLHKNPEPVTALRSNVPLAVEHVLNKALAKVPEDRYQRADLMGADLRTILEGGFVSAPTDTSEATGVRSEGNSGKAQPFASEAEGPVRILVVDDEPDLELLMRQHFRKRLRSGDLDFTFAADGVEALEQLAKDPSLELVMTDIRMPRMDGLQLLGELAKLDRLIKSVVVSAYGDLGNVRMAMNRGAFDFLTKPIDFQDLETTIAKTLKEIAHYRAATEARRRLSHMQQELDVVRRIQEASQPRALPPTSDVDVHVFVSPAQEVGGDFHDFFFLDDGDLVVVMGEVFGTGVAAAITAAVARSLLKATALTGASPGPCLTTVNRLVAAEGLRAMTVNAFFGILDVRSGRFRHAAAGSLAPYLVPAQGGPRKLLQSRQNPLGSDPASVFTEAEVVLERGDAVFLYTDGVTAAVEPTGGATPVERLEAVLGESTGRTSAQLVRDVLRELTGFGDDERSDDVTVLSLRHLGTSG